MSRSCEGDLKAALFWVLACVFVTGAGYTAAAPERSPGFGFPGERGEVQPFPLEQVRLLDGPLKSARQRNAEYLLSLDVDRLLHTWRKNAGLPTDAEPLGGWEKPNCELRGHFLGHYLSACAFLHASTGKQAFKDRTRRIVAVLRRCQEALKGGGYLSAFPESLIDRALNCEKVWAPFYTLHKLMAGLLHTHRYCDSDRALTVARKLADWMEDRVKTLSAEQMQKVLDETEQGGMNEALANLYAVTGEKKYLALARKFQQDSYIEPLANGKDNLTGEHANSFIPNIVGTARLYELTGNSTYLKVARHFWDRVVHTRTYCTGGTSSREAWRKPNVLPLGEHTQEFCCSYNMLKLTRHLTCAESRSAYGDYYERVLWNRVLSGQHPETGMMDYQEPLASGYWKYFCTPRNSFWCCTGSGVESHAKYGRNIYFHGDDELYVSQFIASEVKWDEKRVSVKQNTNFPEEEGTRLRIECPEPTPFTLRIRVPDWAGDGAAIAVNGDASSRNVEPGSYAAVERTWRDGDHVTVRLPMGLHAVSLPQEDNRVAVMYGPLVLAGKLSAEGLSQEKVHTTSCWGNYGKVAEVGKDPVLAGNPGRPDRWIDKISDKALTFCTTNQEENYKLEPLYRIFERRHAIYWQVYRENSEKYQRLVQRQKAQREREARTVDRVKLGVEASENAHHQKDKNTRTGRTHNRHWRKAEDGGWFSYRMRVLPGTPMNLACTYRGGDEGERTFDILVDGNRIATETLDGEESGTFFVTEYSIPKHITAQAQKVTVRFEAHDGKTAGPVYGVAILRRE